jgi:hypothetical protein
LQKENMETSTRHKGNKIYERTMSKCCFEQAARDLKKRRDSGCGSVKSSLFVPQFVRSRISKIDCIFGI